MAIDGADEVDPNLDVVKGRGGALLREKMVEMASDKFVCIVDDSKLVSGLGGSKLAMPVEIVQVRAHFEVWASFGASGGRRGLVRHEAMGWGAGHAAKWCGMRACCGVLPVHALSNAGHRHCR